MNFEVTPTFSVEIAEIAALEREQHILTITLRSGVEKFASFFYGRTEDVVATTNMYHQIKKRMDALEKQRAKLQIFDECTDLREHVESLYHHSPYPETSCGGSFGELLCHELHGPHADASFNPCNPVNWKRHDLTFKQLAKKWDISLEQLGALIYDHCCKLSTFDEDQDDEA